MTGIELITQERAEQVNKHKRTVEADIINNPRKQLRDGAAALLMADEEFMPKEWDVAIVVKMLDKSYHDRLVVAGALIAAEIDRLNYENK